MTRALIFAGCVLVLGSNVVSYRLGRAKPPQVVTETRTLEVQKRVEVERKVPEVKTVAVAGPVRTVVRRERILVPGRGCAEVTTTTREEGPTETRKESKGGEEHVVTAEASKATERVVTVAAPLPRWSLEARAGIPLRFDGATLGLRVVGPVWAVAGVSGWRPVAGARVTW